jgi:hypothetical protein
MIKNCVICRRIFETATSRVTCSETCAKAQHRRRRRRVYAHAKHVPCAACGFVHRTEPVEVAGRVAWLCPNHKTLTQLGLFDPATL